MAIFKLGQETKKETIEDRLNRAVSLGKELAYKEVLQWLECNISNSWDEYNNYGITSKFNSREELFQAFKEQFHIKQLVYIQVRALYCPPVSITKAFQRSETIQSRRSLMGGQFNRTKNWKLTFNCMNINLFVLWMQSFEKSIVDFDKEGWLCTKIKSNKPTQPGCYLTMRQGYSGIYTILDEWKEINGEFQWSVRILDGSQIIAYKPEPIEIPIFNEIKQ